MMPAMDALSDEALLRYSRHILLEEIGVEGQARILAARALVVGAGGLGSPIVLYLAAAGVGHIAIADGDVVDLTNLQRQIAHGQADLGANKAASAARRAQSLNPDVVLEVLDRRLDAEAIAHEVARADVVLDASDNFATRHAINRACVRAGKALVSGAAVRFDGQVAVFDGSREDAPCYHCLFPDGGEMEEMRCAVFGVFAPLVGVIGSIQATEALKIAAGRGSALTGRLLLLDGLAMTWRSLRVPKDPACPVCGGR